MPASAVVPTVPVPAASAVVQTMNMSVSGRSACVLAQELQCHAHLRAHSSGWHLRRQSSGRCPSSSTASRLGSTKRGHRASPPWRSASAAARGGSYSSERLTLVNALPSGSASLVAASTNNNFISAFAKPPVHQKKECPVKHRSLYYFGIMTGNPSPHAAKKSQEHARTVPLSRHMSCAASPSLVTVYRSVWAHGGAARGANP